MHIYIDESGNFLIPKERKSRISSITSLIIPDKAISEVEKSYSILKSRWGITDEIKGSRLTEKQISDTILLLLQHDVLVIITWLNVGHHTSEGIEKYKIAQANKILENVTDEHKESLVKQLMEYKQRVLDLPNQLFLQAMSHIQHIKEIIQDSTLYYSQRSPIELGNFVWIIDAKNNNTTQTPFEELWSTLVLPFLDGNFSLAALDTGDYSYYEKSYEMPEERITPWRRSRMSESSAGATDIRKLISEQLSFEDSKAIISLQLVDIVSSAFSRAMNGTLSQKGWRNLGMLMVKAPDPLIFDLNSEQDFDLEERHILVWRKIKSKLKSIFVN